MSHPFDQLDDTEVLAMFDWLAGVYSRDGLSRDVERVRAIAALVQRRRAPRVVARLDEAGCVPSSWVTVKGTAVQMSVSESAVKKRISAGRLRHALLADGSYRVDPVSIDEWRAERAGRVSA